MFCASRRDVCMYIRPSINMYFQFGPSSILTSAMLMQLLHVQQHGPISGYQVQVATLTWREGQGRSTYKISRTQTASCAVGTKLPDGKEGRNWVIERTYPSYIPSYFREYEILRYSISTTYHRLHPRLSDSRTIEFSLNASNIVTNFGDWHYIGLSCLSNIL